MKSGFEITFLTRTSLFVIDGEVGLVTSHTELISGNVFTNFVCHKVDSRDMNNKLLKIVAILMFLKGFFLNFKTVIYTHYILQS